MKRFRWQSGEFVFFLSVAAAMLLFSTLWRLLFLVRQSAQAAAIPVKVLLGSFVVGWRFDLVIIAYIVAPLYFLSILPWLELSRRKVTRVVILSALIIATAAVFATHLIDLEFFAFFNQRLNGMALSWQDTPGMMFSLVWESYPMVAYLLLYSAMLTLFILALWRLQDRIIVRPARSPILVNLAWAPVMVVLALLAGRGRLADMSPIRTGVAYFSEYDFANRMALNPAYTFWRDAIYDARAKKQQAAMFAAIDCPDADRIIRQLLGMADSTSYRAGERLCRHITFETQNPNLPNIILIMMESFGSTKIGALGNCYPYDLSPRFDSLAREGILFTDFYSTGMHTYCGIFSCFTGCPHQFTELIMKQNPELTIFKSLPSTLRELGYETVCFTTHDPHFDNMQGFVKHNGIERMISALDFPDSLKLGMWGVPDHVLFDRAIDELSAIHRPYFAFILTTSNHGPWLIPDVPFDHIPGDSPKADELNAFKYSDWALGRFVRAIQKDRRFENTYVAVTGDNGSPFKPVFDLELTQYQIPLLLLDMDNRLVPRRLGRLGSQLDVPATLMGLVQRDYDDYSFGRNLLDTTSAATNFAHMSEWFKVGYIEGDYYLIHRLRGEPRTFCRVDNPQRNLADSLPALADEYERKALALFKTSYYNQAIPLPHEATHAAQ